MTSTITLAHVARLMRTAGMRADVDRLGGNVYAIITDDAVTVTIDGGQVSVTGSAELLICRDGGELLRANIERDEEVVPLVTAATAPRWSDQSAELTGLVATETPTERKILANFLLAAGWADARDTDGEQVTAPIDADDITADDATWVAVRKAIREFLARLDDDADAVHLAARRIVTADPEQTGHDLWLTMRGHGAGFWDRGHGAAGELLTEIARLVGDEDAHVEVDMPAAEFDALDTSAALPTITLHFGR